MGRREVIQACMESPLYFTMPLKARLEFVKRHEGQFAPPPNLRALLLSWVKTGSLNSSEEVGSLNLTTAPDSSA